MKSAGSPLNERLLVSALCSPQAKNERRRASPWPTEAGLTQTESSPELGHSRAHTAHTSPEGHRSTSDQIRSQGTSCSALIMRQL